MSYGTFVGELNNGIEGYILAYDNKKEHGGCVLHLRKRPRTIFVPATIVDQHWSEAIYALRMIILTCDAHEANLSLVCEAGVLKVEPQTEPALTPTGWATLVPIEGCPSFSEPKQRGHGPCMSPCSSVDPARCP